MLYYWSLLLYYWSQNGLYKQTGFGPVEHYLRIPRFVRYSDSNRCSPPILSRVHRSSVWLPESRFITEKHAERNRIAIETQLITEEHAKQNLQHRVALETKLSNTPNAPATRLNFDLRVFILEYSSQDRQGNHFLFVSVLFLLSRHC